ncbi:Gryzun, putative trafficking through golgi-domain-containing protein [Rhodocollybia butyracea]|uniref:Gryzun, putative trafficking through golgi-domain-containing protein n=1 Tax=Rhodocollybia butyracea TaxID=206335 RepID=A0A9P5Q4U6_9AGAR|nr:Gryzun, putative trafficking through golgi-domain-containing protein [Rhodocollybia butyracea]
MNSYPLELLAQLAPVMFVAGLDSPPPPAQLTPPLPTAPSLPPQAPAPTHGRTQSRTHSRQQSLTANDPNHPINLPSSSSMPTTTTSSPSSTPATTSTSPTPRPDPFIVLTTRLRDILANQRRVAVWDPPSSNDKLFHVVLVDKQVQFPPRKVSNGTHSPLSPLTPTSPLHPDGLIAPIWIRKHTMLVPAVFVLFTRLFEDTSEDVDRRNDAERQHDTTLSSLIASRKKLTNDRGIKLTVVLMASRHLLDDASLGLDARLTFIRRQSGLDSRAALFVLSPIGKEELGEFVKSLQGALWEPAVEYYTAHSKRVRQKRNRHQAQAQSQARPHAPNPSLSNVVLPIPAPPKPLPLPPIGWTVRYEYKMASFAELRGEYEVALKHYQDAYSALMMLFMGLRGPGGKNAGVGVGVGMGKAPASSSTPVQTSFSNSSPSTPTSLLKRWAEAKVLADTISIKIIKLYFYNDESGLALGQQRLHVGTFPVVAGFSSASSDKDTADQDDKEAEEGTYEYYSWLSKMWCVFAELVVQGTQGTNITRRVDSTNTNTNTNANANRTITIPVHVPKLGGAASGVVGIGIGGVGGVNPSHTLMHPGWYYLLAAECAERKVERYLEAMRAVPRGSGEGEKELKEKQLMQLRALVGDVLELYTKSYELFKAYSSSPSSSASATNTSNNANARLPLYIAHRIALTYTRFPDPNPPPLATSSKNEYDLLPNPSNDKAPDQSDEDDFFGEGDLLTGYGQTVDIQDKDPEKLALAARFLERIAKSYAREVIHSGSVSSVATSASTFSILYPRRPGDASDSDGEDDPTQSWGWPALLVPLLQTRSAILKGLIRREWREWKLSLTCSTTSPESDEKTNPLGEKLELADHLESYVRLLVERMSVGGVKRAQGQVSKSSALQKELIRALQLLNQFYLLSKSSLDPEEGPRKIITIDHIETQPLFDTSVIFWNGRMWISQSRSKFLSTAQPQNPRERTPFQLTLTTPTKPDGSDDSIDELRWAELRMGVKFEFEEYITFASSVEGEHEEPVQVDQEVDRVLEGATEGAEEEPRMQIGIGTQEVQIIILAQEDDDTESASEEEEGGDDAVKVIDIGHIEFGSGFTSEEKVDEKIISVASSMLRWKREQTVVLSGSVGVTSGRAGGSRRNVGEGRVRISSLLLQLNIPSSTVANVEIPLNVPARRGAPPPPPPYISYSSTPYIGAPSAFPNATSIPSVGIGGGGISSTLTSGGSSVYGDAWWFTGTGGHNPDNAQDKEQILKSSLPRWVPVTRKGNEAGFGYDCVEVSHRPHPVSISVRFPHSHHERSSLQTTSPGPAYVGEDYPVQVSVKGCSCRYHHHDQEPGEEEEEELVEVVMDVLLQPVETDVAAINTISIGPHQSNTMIRGIPLGLLILHPLTSSSSSPLSSSASLEITQTLWIKNTGGAGDRVVDMSVRTRPISRSKLKSSLSYPHEEAETLKTITIPCIEPLTINWDVSYRRRVARAPAGVHGKATLSWLEEPRIGSEEPVDDDDEAQLTEVDVEAVVRAMIGCVGSDHLGVEVEKMVLRSKSSEYAQILSSEIASDVSQKENDVMDIFPLGKFLPDDRLSDICCVGISSYLYDDSIDDHTTEIPSLGTYTISWRRILPVPFGLSDNPNKSERGSLSTTTFPLPALQPPANYLTEVGPGGGVGIVALLDIAPVAKLHQPLPLTVIIRNRHPSRTADVYVQLEMGTSGGVNTAGGASGDPSEATGAAGTSSQSFVIAGLRAGRVPLLLAGTEERLTWMLIPVECGYVQLPKVKVIDRRKGARGTATILAGGSASVSGPGGPPPASISGSGSKITELVTEEKGELNERGGKNMAIDAEGRVIGREVRVVDVRLEQRKGQGHMELVDDGEAVDNVIGSVLVLP